MTAQSVASSEYAEEHVNRNVLLAAVLAKEVDDKQEDD